MAARRPAKGAPRLPRMSRKLASASGAELEAYASSLEQACASEPESADLWTCLGVARAAQHRPAKARTAFRKALTAEPAHFFARLHYAELLIELDEHAAAIRELERALAVARTASEAAMASRYLRKLRS